MQLAQLMAYSLVLFLAPLSAETPGSEVFMVVIAVLRLSIFLPLLLGWAQPKGNAFGRQHPLRQCHRGVFVSYTYLAYGMIFVMQQRSARSSNVYDAASGFFTFMARDPLLVLWAINDDPSVSALGYDAIIGLASALAWLWMHQDYGELHIDQNHRKPSDIVSERDTGIFAKMLVLLRRIWALIFDQFLASLAWFVALAAVDWIRVQTDQFLGI